MKLTKKETNYPHIEIPNVRDSSPLNGIVNFSATRIKEEFP
jgi:hypothetical protein